MILFAGGLSVGAQVSESISADIVVVGAGPAGLCAGISALDADNSARVIIVEHQKNPGRKLLITGGGQCNFTHGGLIKEFLAHYGQTGPRIRKILYSMSNEKLRSWFTDLGIESIERSDGKVFPQSLSSGDVVKTLRDTFLKRGGTLLCETMPLDFEISERDNSCKLLVKSGEATKAIDARACVIATGGITYPKTGSDGSFFKLGASEFKRLCISTKPFKPALAPLYPASYPFADMEGFSLSVKLWFEGASNKKVEAKGLLLRADSFSGPAAMDASVLAKAGARFFINFVPNDNRALEEVTQNVFEESHASKKDVGHFVASFFSLPKKLVMDLLSYGMPRDFQKKYAHDLSKAECAHIGKLVTQAQFLVKKSGGPHEGMISLGGFALDEISLSTMSLKKAPCVFVAGECVDVSGDTGGYNLQWAFSSGYVAGRGAAQFCNATE